MKRSLLDFLACPRCRRPLELRVLGEEGAEIEDGLLDCRACPASFPIIAGIPRFVPNALAQHPDFVRKYPQTTGGVAPEEFLRVHGSTQERFSYEWMRYPGPMPEDRDVFLYETQIPSGDWKGKLVLDGGCGMGRYSRVAHELGATVVAMDLGTALVRLDDLARSSDRMHRVQGDLMAPPFKDAVFDTVYSVGVIHHTPSARRTCAELARLVKPKGLLTVWVYGAPGKWKDFRTNPLRADRRGLAKIRFLVWITVVVREALSDFFRLFTVRLPHRLLYGLCYLLAGIGKIPFVKYLTFSVHPDWRVRLQENFDWLTPPYQSHHTKEQVMGWFGEDGFEVLSVLPHGFVPKPGVLGRKKERT